MNIVIFGNGERSLSVFNELKKTNHKISAFIIISKNLNHLIKKIPNNILYSFNNINSNEAILKLKNLNADIFLVAGFSQIFKKNLLCIPKLGTINLHAGKLPYYRGGSPLNWQLINGEVNIGISAILMDEGIDTGNILSETYFTINANDDIKDLHREANKLFPKIALDAISKLIKGDYGFIQDESNACYWHQRQDKDGELNFSNSIALDIHNKIKALADPYPGAWVNFNNKKIIFMKSKLPDIKIKGTPGKVIFINKNGPYIICKDSAIRILKYKVEDDPNFELKPNIYLS